MKGSLKRVLGPALALATLASAQSPKPASDHPPQSQTQTQTKAPPSSGITLHAQAKLVIVDVIVTAKNGAPVHNLTQQDFTLLESGKPQTIGSFDEHSALKDGEALQFSPLPPMSPGVFTNLTPAPVNSAVNVLLIDFLNTPSEDQAYMRAQLTDYLNHARAGTSIGIFTLNNRLHMIQGFTSNPEALKMAVNMQSGQPSPLLGKAQAGGNISSFMPLTEGKGSGGTPNGGNTMPPSVQAPAIATSIQTLQQSIQGNAEGYQSQRLTLDAFNVLARYLANIPGRKNLIWFSGAFPIEFLPNNALNPTSSIQDSIVGENTFSPNPGATPVTDPFAGSNVEAEFRRTTDLLARNQVAVYPVDARGVIASPDTQSDSGTTVNNNGNPADILSTKASFEHDLAAEHSTMERLAFETGGRPFINDNDLSKAVAKALEIGSNYYTLSYTPTNQNWNGDFRRIQVKLAQQGYTLAYRRGYYATDLDQLQTTVTSTGATPAATAKAQDDARLIRASMVHGAPGPTEILYKVRILPTTAIEDTPAPGNVLTPFGVKKAAGQLRRYLVDFDADAGGMLFAPRPDGSFDCKVEFVVQVYQDDGQLVNTVTNALIATLTTAQRNKLIHGGFPFHEEVSIPVNGSYSLRIGIHDFNSDHVGALEVSVDSLKNLPPVPETPAKAIPAPAAEGQKPSSLQ